MIVILSVTFCDANCIILQIDIACWVFSLCLSVIDITFGVLRMQKLRIPLVGALGYQRFPLFKPSRNTARASGLLFLLFWFNLLHVLQNPERSEFVSHEE